MPRLGRSPGEGNAHLLQYSCLETSMDRKPWGLKELDTAEHGHTYTKDYGPGDSPSGNSEELLQRSMVFSSCMSFQNKVH